MRMCKQCSGNGKETKRNEPSLDTMTYCINIRVHYVNSTVLHIEQVKYEIIVHTHTYTIFSCMHL